MSQRSSTQPTRLSSRFRSNEATNRPPSSQIRSSAAATDARPQRIYLDLESVEPVPHTEDPSTDVSKSPREKTLKDYGHCFTGGKLVSISTGAPFEFRVYPNHEDNQRRYHEIGKSVEHHVYGLLIEKCGLHRCNIPVDARPGEPTGFFFASEDIRTAEYLMILIHGSGAVRAGQWSRKLIMNNGLSMGAQIDYIRRARTLGYAVIVTNTNLNISESLRASSSSGARIRGSSCPEEHACYVWENFVRECRASRICIVAHSYGGAVVLSLATSYSKEFDHRVFAVALTDSPMKSYAKHTSPSILKLLQKRTINWIADRSPMNTDLKKLRDYGQLRSAGHESHEWTSYTAFDAIFAHFDQERQKLERGKR